MNYDILGDYRINTCRHGCLANITIPTLKEIKMGHKIVDCIFIGFAHNSNKYQFLVCKLKI